MVPAQEPGRVIGRGAVQLDLFSWGRPRAKFKRIGFQRERLDCRIGPHWWFSHYLVMSDEAGRVVPDLKSQITFSWHQVRD